MELQDKYDELDNIVRTLDNLIDEITIKDYKEQLEETKYQAQEELDKISKKLEKQQEEEENELNYEYERSLI